ncbi:MAG TPA: tyrosine-protein phosphatase [Isosphaeraceae bacterium]|nr:tyrosine-protein phosphatase [Isosphaeraceae bacterium]
MDRSVLPVEAGPARTHRSPLRRRLVPAAAGLALLVALALCGVFRRPWFQGNLGIVDAGRVIRSAQPTTRLPEWIRTHQLRAILNLRGGSPADWWYTAEVRAAEAGHVAFYDLPLSATRRPSRRELLRLIDTLNSCPYPLLIHCKSGADRTGLVTAIYLMIQRGQSPERAKQAFALEHGHIPLGGTEHLHEPIDEYAAWLAARRLPHTPERFRDWVKSHYEPSDCSPDPPRLQPGPRPRRSAPGTRGPAGQAEP